MIYINLIETDKAYPYHKEYQHNILRNLGDLFAYPNTSNARGFSNLTDVVDFTNLDDGNNIFLRRLDDLNYLVSWRTEYVDADYEKAIVGFLTGRAKYNSMVKYFYVEEDFFKHKNNQPILDLLKEVYKTS